MEAKMRLLTPILTLTAVSVIGCAAAPTQTVTIKPVNIAGATVYGYQVLNDPGKRWIEYHAPGGKLFYRDSGRTQTAKWWQSGSNRYCYQWPPRRNWRCRLYQWRGSDIDAIDPKTGILWSTIDRVVPGNPEGFR